MRVLFACYPAHAHLYPFVSCAWALQSAGHEVRVASFGGFAGVIAATGLTPVALGTPGSAEARYDEGALIPSGGDEIDRYTDALALEPAEREPWDIFYQYMLLATADYLRLDRPEGGDLVEFARSWRPDLVVCDPTFPVGAIAARASGAALARFLNGPDIFGWSLERLAARRSQVRAAGLEENPLAAIYRPMAERYGVEVDDGLLLGDLSLDPVPEALRMPTRELKVPVRYVPYNGTAVLPEWLYARPERPRVAVSLGVSTRQAMSGSHVQENVIDGMRPMGSVSGAADLRSDGPTYEMNPELERLAMLMEAVADLHVEVIATLNATQLAGLPRIPDNVRTVRYAPLAQLLPTCSALVHHGGIGTLAAATATKAPQIIFDTGEPARIGITVQEDGSVEYSLPDKKVEATWTSTFVIERGAGARLNHKEQSPEQMRKQIQQVVDDPSFDEGAASLHREWLATPSPGDIVPTLEKLAMEYRERT